MEFGRLASVDDVGFALPVDDPGTERCLARSPAGEAVRSHLGTPRWAEPAYVGTLYPHGAKSGDFLRFYSEQFNCIELNTTYYRVDRPDIARWCDAVPDGFLFCPKFHKLISHEMQLRGAEVATERFFDAMTGFGDRLGPMWLLLPPEFGPIQFAVLEAWLRRFAAGHNLAIELRHPDWFAVATAREAVFGLLEEHGVTAVLTDVAGRRDVLHQRLTTAKALVRFIGNGLHPTDFSRVDDWMSRLSSWCAAGLREVFFFTHQNDEACNGELARYVAPRLAAATGAIVRTPRSIASQGRLFG